jgi:D-amino-acid dehydrogenase
MGKQVIIIGGGVIGLCSAYFLRKMGNEVWVIDKGDITKGTSFGSAGYISPSHFIPLSSPGIVSKGLRWMLSSTSPFYIKPRLDADLIRWGLSFWKNANAKTMERNIPPLVDILNLSRELMSTLKNELGNQFRMAEKGCLMLYKSPSTERHELELANQAAKLGIETVRLNAQQVQDLEPEVEVKVRGAILYPLDCHLHPGDFMRTLKNSLESSGVIFRLGTEVKGFEKKGSRVQFVLTDQEKISCEELVIAAGSWLPLLTKKLGIPLLLQAGKGYSFTYSGMKKNLNYPAILVDDRVAMTPMGGDLRMGGTMEISGINDRILIKRVRAIFNASRNYYPGLELAFPPLEKIWSGLRPLSPDGLPYIGRHSSFENLTLAGGHAMLGLSLAAGTGKLVEEIVGSCDTSISIDAFRVERFR